MRQDLEIMIKAAKRQMRESELEQKYELLYVNMPELVFQGTRARCLTTKSRRRGARQRWCACASTRTWSPARLLSFSSAKSARASASRRLD